jgi:hypothetical protein
MTYVNVSLTLIVAYYITFSRSNLEGKQYNNNTSNIIVFFCLKDTSVLQNQQCAD